jgi:hypothetical protein
MPVSITLTFRIPATLEKLLMSFALAYHRLCYGYSVRLIPVGQGKYAIVDVDDYERLAKYKWSVHYDGNTYYAFRHSSRASGKKRQRLWMHHEIIDIPEGLVCDHINHNGLNNRRANVRPATVSQNNCNTRKRGQTTSRYRGVSQAARPNKWRGQIRVNGRLIHLGVFDDEVDAAKAYDTAARKYHGEFAVLNFPDRTPSWIIIWLCGFFAAVGGRIKQSLRTRPKGSPTSPRAESRGLLEQISPLASPGRNDDTACDISSAKHRFGICRFFQKVYQNSVKMIETCVQLIEIARSGAIMSIVQMARGP